MAQKMIDLEKIDKLAKALDSRTINKIAIEKERSMGVEAELQNTIGNVQDMLGGRSIVYLTQEEYNVLSEEEKNNDTVTYFITDAEDLSHEHANKDFLDGLSQDIFEEINADITELNTTVTEINNSYATAEYVDTNIELAIDEVEETFEEVSSRLTSLETTTSTLDSTYAKIDSVNSSVEELEGQIGELEEEIISSVTEALKTVDAISLNGYSLWVGTTEELEQIEERDEKTLYFEIGESSNETTVVLNNPINNVLNLTTDKYQKATSIQTDTIIVFPEVEPDKLIEIHLFFEAEENINLIFPDDCKWRVDANIEEGKAYEIVMTYNTISWLADIIVYSH